MAIQNMIVPAYPGRVVLRFKYNQMCFFLLEIFEVENSHGIFLGFVIGPIRSPLSLEIRSTPLPRHESSSLLPIVTSSVLMVKECRDLSNHTKMSTIQSRTTERKAKTDVTLL